MIKLAVLGARGRMGRAILDVVGNPLGIGPEFDCIAKVVDKTELESALASIKDGKDLTHDVKKAAERADVVIDFTSPEATLINAPVVALTGKPYVVGTTGLAGGKRDAFLSAVKHIPVVFSANMSLSANVLFDAAERVARALPGYDNEIVEVHHNLKKDAPSGTAQTLADSVQRGKNGGSFTYGRRGLVGERKKDEIGIHAVRGGDVVGDHTVFFLGAGERIELVHRVTSREAFAQGALVAAKWLVQNKRPAGLYDMRDVLGLR